MSDKKLLQQFVDSFARLDDMTAPEDTSSEIIAEPDKAAWDGWGQPLSRGVPQQSLG